MSPAPPRAPRRRSPPLGPVWSGLIYAFYSAFGTAVLLAVGVRVAMIGASSFDVLALGLGAGWLGLLLVPCAAILGFFFGMRAARNARLRWLAEPDP